MMEACRVVDSIVGCGQITIQGKPFYKGQIQGKPVVLVVSGIGKANAAHASGLLIDRYSPSMLINIGVAGAYPSSGLNVGDVVIAEREIYADEGLFTASGEFVDMKGLNLPLSHQNDKALFNSFPTYIPPQLYGQLPKGLFLTLSSCTGSLTRALELEGCYGPVCENMEGAAVAQIAAFSSIPFLEIRSISNVIKDRDKEGIEMQDLLRASEAVQTYFIEKALPAS